MRKVAIYIQCNKLFQFFLKYSIILLVLISMLSGCTSAKEPKRQISTRLESLKGKGNVDRKALTKAFLLNGAKDTLLDFSNYALPINARTPSNLFEGKLTLSNLDTSGNFQELKDIFGYTDSVDIARMHLPSFDYEFVQSESYIIPIEKGYIENEHPTWEYILEPGRVWDEIGDEGFSRVTIPFTLKQKNQNCLHNGMLMFLFRDDGTISSVSYQIASETCAYFKFNMWGTVNANYSPYSINSRDSYIQDHVSEVMNRLPVRPISELTKYYPKARPNEFGLPKAVSKEAMTLFGLVIDSVNYTGGCKTRFGTYPFCENLVLPSYSTAKSISAAIGLMRMEKLYPGISKQPIDKLILEDSLKDNWSDVTLEHALDMSTGNYENPAGLKDEGAPHTSIFFLAEDHKTKLEYSYSYYSKKSKPGSKWVYHTSDTYLLGTAMNYFLQAETNDAKADYFSDIIVNDIFRPLGTSITSSITQRTYDTIAQPFSGFGLFFKHDDVAKIGQFLNQGARINKELVLDEKMYNNIMQPTNKTSLTAVPSISRYDNGFWFLEVEIPEICLDKKYITYLEGYGGIRIFLLPNDTVYYYFSDNYEYAGLEAIIESNRIRTFCNKSR